METQKRLGECSDLDMGLMLMEDRGKEGNLGRESLSLQCSSKNFSKADSQICTSEKCVSPHTGLPKCFCHSQSLTMGT